LSVEFNDEELNSLLKIVSLSVKRIVSLSVSKNVSLNVLFVRSMSIFVELVGPVTVRYSIQTTSAYDRIDMQQQRHLPSSIIW
jgi:hypothetical protein